MEEGLFFDDKMVLLDNVSVSGGQSLYVLKIFLVRLFIDPWVFNFNILWFQCLLLLLREERWLLLSCEFVRWGGLPGATHISVFHRIVSEISRGLSLLHRVGVGGFANRERLHLSPMPASA